MNIIAANPFLSQHLDENDGFRLPLADGLNWNPETSGIGRLERFGK
ncbi:hypothetical protein SH528x_001517 [Novipirellula sp. SH528]